MLTDRRQPLALSIWRLPSVIRDAGLHDRDVELLHVEAGRNGGCPALCLWLRAHTENGDRLTKQGGAGRFFLRSVNSLWNNGATTI